MAKVGDKYIVEIAERIACDESHDGDLYRIKGFNTLIFDDFGLNKLEKVGTTEGLDLPEATDQMSAQGFMTEMKKEVDKLWESWQVLRGNLCQAERKIVNNREDINTLWDHMLEDEGIRDKKK